MNELLWCPVCAEETLVESVPCPDGHGEDCGERVCTRCSMAILAGATISRSFAA